MHDDGNEAIGHLAVGYAGAVAEHLGHGGVLRRHPIGGRDDGARGVSAQSALALPARDVLPQQVENRQRKLAVVFERGLVALQGGEHENPVNSEVAAKGFDHPFDDGADQAFVVVALHAAFPLRDALGQFAAVVVVVEHCIVQVLLGGKVAEDYGLGDAGGGGDFLGGGASESLAGEYVEGRFEELQAAVAGREAEGWGTKFAHRFHCKSVLTYSQAPKPFGPFWCESPYDGAARAPGGLPGLARRSSVAVEAISACGRRSPRSSAAIGAPRRR